MASTSTSSSDLLNLSFGIEIEAILLFNQQRIEEHLRTARPSARLHKGDFSDRSELVIKPYTDLVYHSWTIAGDLPDQRYDDGEHDFGEGIQCRVTEHEGVEYRRYLDEPLHIAAQSIREHADAVSEVKIHGSDFKQTEYGKLWTLSNDVSLGNLPRAQVQQLVGTTGDDWDSYGIELISPPRTEQEMSVTLKEIEQLQHALSQSSVQHTITEDCGVHVHVGTPDNSGFSLATLQQLAVLTLIYEDAISTLHPVTRRANAASASAVTSICTLSNRCKFEQAYDWPIIDGIEYTTRLTPVAQLRQAIFATKTIEELVNMVSDTSDAKGVSKNHYVNWSYLVKQGRPPTIEFRQHAGSLSSEDIGHWLRFCLALVKLAASLAEQPRQGPWDSVEWGNDNAAFLPAQVRDTLDNMLRGLLSELSLPQDTKEHLLAAADKYRAQEKKGDVAVYYDPFEVLEDDGDVDEQTGVVGPASDCKDNGCCPCQ